MDKNQKNAVNEFLKAVGYIIEKDGIAWVVRTKKGKLSKHFPPSTTKEGLYEAMFTKLVEQNVIKVVVK